MSLPIFLLFVVTFSQVRCGPTVHMYNSTNCDGFQSKFDVKSILGIWQVVAIIPEKLFPDKSVNCYKVEFRESDLAGLRWLINKTKMPKANASKVEEIDGTIVRQRYYTEQDFDVWSKSVKGVNGCFQQVLSLDVGVNLSRHDHINHFHKSKSIDPQKRGFGCRRNVFGFRRHAAAAACRQAATAMESTEEALKHDAMMQLHLVDAADNSGPYLLQMLWGRLISAVIYKRGHGVTQEQLKPAFEVMSKLRGPQRLPKICENPLRDLLFKE